MNQSTHQLAQRLNRDADRLSDRPMPAELDRIRGQIRRLWVAIDMEYTAEVFRTEQAGQAETPTTEAQCDGVHAYPACDAPGCWRREYDRRLDRALAQSGGHEDICTLCGSELDTGYECQNPHCRNADPDRPDYDPAPERMAITIERAPRCLWHSDCDAGEIQTSGIMRIADSREGHDLFECLSCKRKGWVPHGTPFGTPICVDVVPTDPDPDPPQPIDEDRGRPVRPHRSGGGAPAPEPAQPSHVAYYLSRRNGESDER